MQKLVYYAFRVLVAIMRITPLWLLYILADFIYIIFYYVLKYRKSVVYGNLSRSFPEKSEKEIDALAKKFYHHLADIFAESLKGLGIGKEEVIKRYSFKGTDLVHERIKQGKTVLLAGTHCGNWEWGALSTPHYLEPDIYTLYKPLSNKYIDAYLKKQRADQGMYMIPTTETREIFQRKFEHPVAFILLSDQSPHNPRRAFWMNFLHQETGFLHGFEMQARRYGHSVVFFRTTKIKRGYYQIEFELITDTPKDYEPGMLTKEYAKRLEKLVLDDPAVWVWSHKRWRRQRPEGKPLL
ncbi:acetyltransferase [Fulvitalea axinellae]|uniref:Acetyltransferase n=1 Tax=Fulvitalea axinellae TaxID=1182444 RepID=A0AAU9C9G4_9BACT|nr:acetyltransferase [Fulvitalea axinellae]